MNKKMLITYTLLMLSISLNSKTNNNSHYEFIKNYNDELLKSKKDSFNNTMEFIKSHEGFRKYPYICSRGYRTNGHGFITKYIPKQYRDSITKTQAHVILKNKLNRCINYVNKIYPNLNYNQSLAVAHLGYAKGFESIRNHELHKQLLEGVINDSTWIYFGKYEMKYESYKANREFELNMFKNEKI